MNKQPDRLLQASSADHQALAGLDTALVPDRPVYVDVRAEQVVA